MEGNAQIYANLVPARSSMEQEDDDALYRQVVAIANRPRNPPPSYEASVTEKPASRRKGKALAGSVEHIERSEEESDSVIEAEITGSASDGQEGSDMAAEQEELEGEHRRSTAIQQEVEDSSSTGTGSSGNSIAAADSDSDDDSLPPYSCDIHIEGVFKRKMEMVETTKRAQDRHWTTNFIQLHGTALNIYTCKKESFASGRTKDIDAYVDEHRGQRSSKKKSKPPKPSPDNPPWIRPGELQRRYNLSYADVGIAADYMKKRYVIRVRVETDQFLLSCLELSTLVSWLDALYAAIGVAAPIDQREFPRDHSIPRLQRLRWLRQNAVRTAATTSGDTVLPARLPSSAPPAVAPLAIPSTEPCQEPARPPTPPPELPARTVSAPLIVASSPRPPTPPPPASEQPAAQTQPTTTQSRLRLALSFSRRANSAPNTSTAATAAAPRHEGIDRETGKWRPRHRWSQRHDHVYAKLCYGVLLFRSPRKSNYVVGRGGLQEWFVDWATGRMVRVSPPGYGEQDMSMTVGNGMGRAR